MAAPVNNPLIRTFLRAPARRQVANPVLARYLDELAKADRLASQWDADAAAAIARRTGGLDADAIPPPRGPLPPADYNAAVESVLPQRGYEVPFADELRRIDRTRALVNNRLDRLTPEQQASSLPFVGRLADWDARMARRQFMESDMDLPTRIGLAGGAAALGTAGYMKMAEDAQVAEEEIARAEEEAAAELAAQELLVQQAAEAVATDDGYSLPMSIDIGEDDLIDVSGIGAESELDDYGYMTPQADVAGLVEDDPVLGLFHDSPQEEAYSPPVVVEQEPLPGPQARSIQALMRAGLPEERARDIILKGYSMSPEEYRAVTGGRR